MKQIWKFQLEIADKFSLHMPSGAKILKVDWQNGRPHMWAEVYTDNEPEVRTFCCHGTGHSILGNKSWIGTVCSNTLVWHFYEEIINEIYRR